MGEVPETSILKVKKVASGDPNEIVITMTGKQIRDLIGEEDDEGPIINVE